MVVFYFYQYYRHSVDRGGSFIYLSWALFPRWVIFLPLFQSIGNVVLFVAYLQLFGSALKNIKHLNFNHQTIYRVAAPALLGLAIMNLQPQAFLSLPILIQPLISTGC